MLFIVLVDIGYFLYDSIQWPKKSEITSLTPHISKTPKSVCLISLNLHSKLDVLLYWFTYLFFQSLRKS